MPSPRANTPLTLAALLASPSELTDAAGNKCAIVLMTRIRLARNLAKYPFPSWAKEAQRRQILDECRSALAEAPQMKKSFNTAIDGLNELDRQILVERHLISRELSGSKGAAGVVISKDQTLSVMVNEEDHLRIQCLRAGFQLKRTWSAINDLDSALEGKLDFAFNDRLGYLTACPTNLGTGMRASAMMHLPALVISGQMEKIVRAVNQLGMVVRGLFGEGSDASGSIFQISNQTTLGESEAEILKRLSSVLNSIIEHELNARNRLMETESAKMLDKIGRAFGIVQNSYLLSSGEAMNLLSLLRLGVDLGLCGEPMRASIDRLFIEAQPGHVQLAMAGESDSSQRDRARADRLRTEFASYQRPAPLPPTSN